MLNFSGLNGKISFDAWREMRNAALKDRDEAYKRDDAHPHFAFGYVAVLYEDLINAIERIEVDESTIPAPETWMSLSDPERWYIKKLRMKKLAREAS